MRSVIDYFCHLLEIGNYKLIIALLLVIVFVPNDSFGATLSKPSNNLGLVGYWSFDEGAGTVAHDGSGSGNTGTLTNGPSWTGGKTGKGISFDGVDDYAQINDATSLDVTGAISIGYWFKTTTVGTSMVLEKRESSNSNIVYGCLLNDAGASNKMRCYVKSLVGSDFIDTATSVNDGKWKHIVFTHDGVNTAKIYVDGVLDNTATINPAVSGNAANLYLGSRGGSSVFSAMSLDEVRIYNRALSATEVGALYNKNATKFKGVSNQGLVGYWSFDEATSTIAHDQSGSGNNGTLTNMAAPATATSGWGNGKLAGGLNFDGTNDYVERTSSTNLPTLAANSWSFSIWVYPTLLQDGTIIFDWGDPTSGTTIGSKRAILRHNGGIYFASHASDLAVSPDYSTATDFTLNAWNYVMATWNGTTLTMYKNGVNIGSSNLVGLTNSGSSYVQFAGPASLGWQRNFVGKLDDARLYNRTLSATEVATLYNQGATKFQSKTENTVAQSGLVGYWSFNGKDMNGTTAYDRSGSGNDGTLTNGPSRVAGKLEQGLFFDGTNDYVSVSSPSNFPTGASQRTAAFWAKSNASTGNFQIGFQAGPITTTNGWGMGIDQGTSRWYVSQIGGSVQGNVANWGQWEFIVATFDGTTYSLYQNGALVNSGALSTDTSPGAFTIGEHSSNYWFNGSIDEVRIYNTALSASEVKGLYLQGR